MGWYIRMSQSDGKFRHDSLQDRKTIKALLTALTKGIGVGEITLSDGDANLSLPVEGLLALRIKGERSNGNCRVDLQISWSESPASESKRTPQIK